MSHSCVTIAAIILATLASGTQAQERRPFHVARFADDRTISLTITSAAVSEDIEYDYDVWIGLTDHRASGEAIFIDNGTHVVRVRCALPSTVLVGSSAHILLNPPEPGDWKADLWKVLCLQPVS